MESAGVALLNQPSAQKQEPVSDVPFLRRKRYFVTILVFLGMVLQSFQEVNLFIVIVDMTTDKKIHDGNQTYVKEAEFKWTPFEKGFLLSCTSILGFFSFLGGPLSCRYGGVRVFGLTIFILSVLSILTPVVVSLGVPVFAILRMICGLCGAINMASLLQIFIRWSPATEKFRLIDYSASEFFFGIIAVFPVCGVILEKWSWSWVFFLSEGFIFLQSTVFGFVIPVLAVTNAEYRVYFISGTSIVWYIIWTQLIYDDPLEDKFISLDEQKFIKENVQVTTTKTETYPWLKILSSKAVWAYLNERFVEAWSFSFSTQCLPTYINDAFNISISEVGLLSSVPNLCNLLGMIAGGHVADLLFCRSSISHSKIYIGSITLCHITCIILLLIMGLWVDYTGSIICICILRFVFGGAGSMYSVLPLDIAGEYGCIVRGIGNSVFVIGSIFNPILVTYVVPNQNLPDWRRYFLLLSAFNVWGAIFFFFCGTGEPEPWSKARKKVHPK